MVSLSREEQDKKIAEFIAKNGVIRLKPDARIKGGTNEEEPQNSVEVQAAKDSEEVKEVKEINGT
tara:strand:- start:241 stop:435 length:195 start_codon:yes stop_codon:yes gene_type:complete